ncbi:phosphocarrier protein Hpr [Candidatus Arthromitus sp. SFB-mouse-Japan]|uniref:HPr family phosphocarrier protein n=1 Tax=unclassified Candidatus Neoarthromitus TaxID=2638829 RepID=UPI00021B7C7C|nr:MULTISPECIES: HPr family phosphocarrier protein [unclassified Candidatus Arthromitus]EIA23031.1 Phosphocarrier protein [Candidatus Arthromitus sp. SFB-1]EIA24039.1 Phosphocarrier protein [Candidatus Arthromitus sp. SFB-3]EIA27485.1 Phosphocarrier protein [Candidatus Arthromitus sp. SFB-co]EIA29132.1 Phosphocarrier protein [Candidatus Arthromitus sp. SFB-4]EIA30802.1 Phosphocarrier protein [Candidatus Arthromitus sp. SFB-mouse-SU]
MESIKVKISNNTGLHARPATLLVKKASSFACDVSVEANGKKVNAKSLIGILSLGATKDTEVTIITSGKDEVEAANELAKLIETLED